MSKKLYHHNPININLADVELCYAIDNTPYRNVRISGYQKRAHIDPSTPKAGHRHIRRDLPLDQIWK